MLEDAKAWACRDINDAGTWQFPNGYSPPRYNNRVGLGFPCNRVDKLEPAYLRESSGRGRLSPSGLEGLLIYLATAGEKAFAIGPCRLWAFSHIPSKLPLCNTIQHALGWMM